MFRDRLRKQELALTADQRRELSGERRDRQKKKSLCLPPLLVRVFHVTEE